MCLYIHSKNENVVRVKIKLQHFDSESDFKQSLDKFFIKIHLYEKIVVSSRP